MPPPPGPNDHRGDRESVYGKAVPVGAAVAAYGLSYGVLAVGAGLPPALTVLSSVLVFAAGAQFAFVSVLVAGGNPFAGAVAGLLLNLRYLAFGFAIAARLPGGSLGRRLVDGYLIVDEAVALALTGPREQTVRRFRVMGWIVVAAWISASAVGAYGGRLLGDTRALGLDAAFPAGFLALVAPWLRTRSGRVAALVGAALALGLTPVAPPGVPVLAAGLGALVAYRIPDGGTGAPVVDGGEPEVER